MSRLILVVVILLGISIVPSVYGAWDEADCQYRREVPIQYTGINTTLYGYVKFINVTTTPDTTYWHHSDGTLLPYFNFSTTLYAVRVPEITNSANTSIYYYYGCDSPSTRNGNATFDFFDDFLGGTLNATSWFFSETPSGEYTYSVSGGYLKIANSGGGSTSHYIVHTNKVFPVGKRVGFAVNLSVDVCSLSTAWADYVGFTNSTATGTPNTAGATYIHADYAANGNCMAHGMNATGGTYGANGKSDWRVNQMYIVTWNKTNIDAYNNTWNLINSLVNPSKIPNTPLPAGITGNENRAAFTEWYDYFWVSGWVDKEPYYYIGVEEENAGGSAAPVITIDIPSNMTYTNLSIPYRITAYDMTNSSFRIKIYDNQTLLVDNTSFTNNSIMVGTLTYTNSGYHNFTVLGIDQGDESQENILFTVDVTDPSLTINEPSLSSYIFNLSGNTSISFNYTAYDIHSGIDKCWYSLNGGANTSLSSCANTTLAVNSSGYYDLRAYSNDTVGHTKLANKTFFVDLENTFYVYNIYNDTMYFNFNISISNGTVTTTNESVGYVGRLYTSNMPYGNTINVTIWGDGFNTSLTTIPTLNSSSRENISFPVYRAGLYVTGVYDEQTQLPICYNFTVFNASSTYQSGMQCGSLFVDTAQLPTGTNVKVVVENTSYIQRDYYVTVNPTTYMAITPYLLGTGSGSYITVLVYSLNGVENGALVTANRFLNNSFRTVAQSLTDSQGKGYFYLYPYTTYQILAERGTLQGSVDPYYPNPSYILQIMLNGTVSYTNISWVFDTVSIVFTPSSQYLWGVQEFSYLVSASENDLSYYNMSVWGERSGIRTYLYSEQIEDSPHGGNLLVNVNVTNQSLIGMENIGVFINFKRSGYDEWNYTYHFIPQYNINYTAWGNVNYTNFTIPNFLEDIRDGGLGITSRFAQMMIAFFVALSGGAVVGRFTNTFGGAIIFIGVLGIFALIGWFAWQFVILLSLIAIGFYVWRNGWL